MAPGQHNVCAESQSNASRKAAETVGAARTLTVEAGMVYYLRIIFEEFDKIWARTKLELTDNAEGQFLLSSSALSNSHPKK